MAEIIDIGSAADRLDGRIADMERKCEAEKTKYWEDLFRKNDFDPYKDVAIVSNLSEDVFLRPPESGNIRVFGSDLVKKDELVFMKGDIYNATIEKAKEANEGPVEGGADPAL